LVIVAVPAARRGNHRGIEVHKVKDHEGKKAYREGESECLGLSLATHDVLREAGLGFR
jgi:hypothetical protein